MSIIQTERLKLPNVKLWLNQGISSWHYWQQRRLPVIRKQVRSIYCSCNKITFNMIIREKRLGACRHSQALKFEERTQTYPFRSVVYYFRLFTCWSVFYEPCKPNRSIKLSFRQHKYFRIAEETELHEKLFWDHWRSTLGFSAYMQ